MLTTKEKRRAHKRLSNHGRPKCCGKLNHYLRGIRGTESTFLWLDKPKEAHATAIVIRLIERKVIDNVNQAKRIFTKLTTN